MGISVGRVNEDVVRAFWAAKAGASDNRWTSSEMQEWELAYLRPLLPVGPARILDLGSGHGNLSRTLCRPGDTVLAVDREAAYGRAFEGTPHRFINSPIGDFETSDSFDLILVFGVVTYLEEEEEDRVYSLCKQHAGIAVVKNQCSRSSREVVVNGYSTALQSDYSARYPAPDAQLASLSRHFSAIQTKPYPDHFNPWPDTMHVAFIAST